MIKSETIEELKIQYPSSNPLALLGVIPTYKSDEFNYADVYATLYGTGTISENDGLLIGQLSLGKYDFLIIGNKLRAIYYYKGVTKYKEYVSDERMSLGSILKNGINMDKSEFINKLKLNKDDTFYIIKFKEKALQILKEAN